MATLALVAVGAIVGAAIGYAALPGGQTQEGPRVEDLNVTGASYGNPIKIVFGAMRVGGNMIWAAPLKETRVEKQVGGKGGGPTATQVSYTYNADFAVGLCEGQIITVTRIWADSVLLYDKRGTIGATGFVASLDIDGTITIYPGSETQTPDPTIESYEGAGNVPAHRGLAYIVFEDLALEKFGNRIPQITAEVVQNGDAGSNTTTTLAYNPDIGHTYYVISTATRPSATNPSSIPKNGNNPVVFSYKDGLIRVGELNSSTAVRVYKLDGTFVYSDTRTTAESYFRVDSPIDNGWMPGGLLANDCYFHTNFSAVYNSNQQTVDNVSALCQVLNANGSVIFDVKDILPAGRYFGGITPCAQSSYAMIFTAPASTWDYPTGGASAVIDTWHLMEWDGYQGVIISTGTVNPKTNLGVTDFGQTASKDWGAHMMESDLRTIWNHHVDTVGGDSVSYRQIDSSGNFDPTGVFSSTYDVGATSCKGGVWGNNGIGIMFAGNNMWVFTRATLASANAPTLQAIVSNIADRAGVAATDTDFTALTSTVYGYCISRQMTARAAIQPLQNAGMFDIIESDNKLKGVFRGSATVTTISSSELGAGVGSPESELVEITRKQEAELPKRISVGHIDPTADYSQNLQYAARQTTDAVNDIKFDLVMALQPAQAAQIAERQLFSIWENREQWKFKTDMTWVQFEPGDVVTVAVRGRSQVVRITDVSLGDGVLEFTCVAEDPDIYRSYASGVNSNIAGQALGILGPTHYEMMDIPLLQATDDDSGFYAAFGGYISGWPGCQLSRSDDGGETYTKITSQGNEATMGISTDALASAKPTIWDYANSFNCNMLSGTPAAAGATAVLNGTNVALLGDEIIAYMSVTQEADGSYTFAKLLRGLRGTEWAISGHSTEEHFILLNTGTTIRYDPGTSLIGLSKYYKATTLGKYEAETDAFTFTNNANGLKPYSPAHFTASAPYGGGDDIHMTWMRRERTDGEWRDYVDVPLGETGMTFDLEITDSAGSVLNTVSAIATTAYTYPAASALADYGVRPGMVYARLYQISSTVGRGYPASAIFTIAYSSAVPSLDSYISGDGPFAYYQLNEPSGAKNHMNSALYAGSPVQIGAYQATAVASTVNNYSMYFAAASCRIIMPNFSTLFTGANALTVEMWAKAYAGNSRYFVMDFNQNAPYMNFQFYASTQTHEVRAMIYDGTQRVITHSSTGFLVTEPHHYVMTAEEGGRFKLYIDAVGVGSTTMGTFTTYATNAQNFMGRSVAKNHEYWGWLDELAFYTTALSSSKISTHHTRGVFTP